MGILPLGLYVPAATVDFALDKVNEVRRIQVSPARSRRVVIPATVLLP
jgi:hypothetical protein